MQTYINTEDRLERFGQFIIGYAILCFAIFMVGLYWLKTEIKKKLDDKE